MNISALIDFRITNEVEKSNSLEELYQSLKNMISKRKFMKKKMTEKFKKNQKENEPEEIDSYNNNNEDNKSGFNVSNSKFVFLGNALKLMIFEFYLKNSKNIKKQKILNLANSQKLSKSKSNLAAVP